MRTSLIIAAAGNGSRFRQGLKAKPTKKSPSQTKLFYPLRGRPLLAHTLHSFQKISQVSETIVALPPGVEKQFAKWAKQQGLNKLKCVPGGKTRADSVLAGIKSASKKSDWVMVHDGARPLIAKDSIQKLLSAPKGKKADGFILARKVVPTIKKVSPSKKGSIQSTVDRAALYEAETPQLVRRKVFLDACKSLKDLSKVTDEASLLEQVGRPVFVVEHEAWNPKVTTAQDLELVEAYMNQKDALTTRMGMGRDTHRLVEGRKFMLGGLRLKSKKGPLGHSDGDALLHAITDAVLGASGCGDIGDLFSDKNPKFKNIASEKMLQVALDKVAALGWAPAQVDTIVHLENPKLSPYKQRLCKNIARILNLKPSEVSVKAKTFEGLGAGGKGEAISCEALVMMKRCSYGSC